MNKFDVIEKMLRKYKYKLISSVYEVVFNNE